MDKQTALLLADHACPSIAYRIKKEIFKEDCTNPTMLELQHQITRLKEVERIFALKKDDGWLGGLFHGVDEPESVIRFLIEMGLEPTHPTIEGALSAIISRGTSFDEGCMHRVGKPLDSQRLGGSQLIKACIFAHAGNEHYDFVLERITESLEVFDYVCSVAQLADIYTPYRDRLVFRSGVLWPSIYHLRLLAYTQSWRSRENLAMMARAISKLTSLSPIPSINLLYKHQVIAPASACMHSFNDDMGTLSPKEWMLWFHRTELIARLGIASKIPPIMAQINYVNNLRAESNGLYTKKLRHYYFTKWTQYLGLALEDEWKTSDKAVNDLTFRCLLINSLI